MIYMFLAEGFEEIEAIMPLDILRRAGANIQTVGIESNKARGAHNIEIVADTTLDKISDNIEMLILPGGMPGTDNLQKNEDVIKTLMKAYENGAYIAAICAAPKIFGELGLLKGKKATCFPGFEKYLTGAVITGKAVEIDNKIITSRGAGTADKFGFALTSLLFGNEKADSLRKTMQFDG
ncbi:MAG: DJ-1/PfpI family protein [Firmicutes bacterium]|nr:DJ-1/PfpI family protein [Bacillota bacterium]